MTYVASLCHKVVHLANVNCIRYQVDENCCKALAWLAMIWPDLAPSYDYYKVLALNLEQAQHTLVKNGSGLGCWHLYQLTIQANDSKSSPNRTAEQPERGLLLLCACCVAGQPLSLAGWLQGAPQDPARGCMMQVHF